VLSNGLLTSDGDLWLRQRRLAQRCQGNVTQPVETAPVGGISASEILTVKSQTDGRARDEGRQDQALADFPVERMKEHVG
jgi:hypothetical protein